MARRRILGVIEVSPAGKATQVEEEVRPARRCSTQGIEDVHALMSNVVHTLMEDVHGFMYEVVHAFKEGVHSLMHGAVHEEGDDDVDEAEGDVDE